MSESPLKPHHCEKLDSESGYKAWSLRFLGYLGRFADYKIELTHPTQTPEGRTKQGHIYDLLIATVREEGGFDALTTVQPTLPDDGRLAFRAWRALERHYLSAIEARVGILMTQLRAGMRTGELVKKYISRLLNLRIEIQKAGENISDLIMRDHIIQGLRKEYRSEIAHLIDMGSNMTLSEFASRIITCCERVEERMAREAASDSVPAGFLGSVNDPYGYQQPPDGGLSTPMQTGPGPHSVTLTDVDNAHMHLHSVAGNISASAFAAIQRVMPTPARTRTGSCFKCGAPGHHAYECPHGPYRPRASAGRGQGLSNGRFSGGRNLPTPGGRGQTVPQQFSVPTTIPLRPAPPPPPPQSNPPAPQPSSRPDDHGSALYTGEERLDDYEYDYDPVQAEYAAFAPSLELADFSRVNGSGWMCIAETDEPSPIEFVTADEEVAFAARDTRQMTCTDLGMATLGHCRICPLPRHIEHLVELCSGGTLAFLTKVLASGATIGCFTLSESSNSIRYVALHRLRTLQAEYPRQLPLSAIAHWTTLPQNVNQLTAESFSKLPPVTVIASTPPCPPFSRAANNARTSGWDRDNARAFISCVNLTHSLYNAQKKGLTYIFENVPGILSFRAVVETLGPPVMAEAISLGSSSHRDTALWTNGAPHSFLEEDLKRHCRPGLTVQQFLEQHGYAHEYQAPATTQYWSKFVARPGSWAFSFQADSQPGPGMLWHVPSQTYVEPPPDIREESMGMPRGCTAAPGASQSLRHTVTGNAVDHNIAGWFISALYRYADSLAGQSSPDKAMLTSQSYPDDWVVDGGATRSCSSERSDFVDYQPANVFMRGLNLRAVGQGTVVVMLPTSEGPRIAHIRNVLHIPGLRTSGVLRLLSQRACHGGSTMDPPTFVFAPSGSAMQFRRFAVNLDHHHHQNLYTLHSRVLTGGGLPPRPDAPSPASSPTILGPAAAAPSPPTPFKKPAPKALSARLWHLRAGHIAGHRLTRLPQDCTGVAISPGALPFCNSCAVSKASRQPSGRGETDRSSAPFSHVGCDIWCNPTASIHNYYYVLGFTCYGTRWVCGYLMRTKDEAPSHLRSYLKWVRSLHHNVEHIRCDSDTVFKGQDWLDVLIEFETVQTFSAPYTPSENGLAERTWGICMTMAKAMLATAQLPDRYWEFAVMTAFYLANRLWSSALGSSPFTALTRSKPDLRMLRIWGCPCWVVIPPNQRRKLADKAWKGIFVGYPADTRGWLVFNPATRRTVVTKHVVFDETFGGRLSEEGIPAPPKELANSSQQTTEPPIDSDSDEEPTATPQSSAITPADNQNSGQQPTLDTPANNAPANTGTQKATPLQGSNPNSSSGSAPDNTNNRDGNNTVYNTPEDSPNSSPVRPSDLATSEEGPRRSSRPNKSQPPERLIAEGYLSHQDHKNAPALDPYLRHVGAYLSATGATPVDPSSRKKALASPFKDQWLQAEREEYSSLKDMGTWTLVPLPADRRAIACKWVYKVKHNADGTVARFKARLVAKGFTQIEGIDYEETFAPTAKFNTIRLLLSLANSLQWPVEQCDIDTAFLNANLEEDIYMSQPEGYEDPDHPLHVCKLQKSLYGLKQAAYLWNQLLAEKLKILDFNQLKTDSSCFVKRDEHGTAIILAVYVDDILIAARTPALAQATKDSFKRYFKVKDLGECKWILGIAVERDPQARKTLIHQQKYIMDLAARFNIPATAERKTPHAGGDATPASGNLMTDPSAYRSLVGSLLYAAVATRPDIMECVSRLCRKIQSPTDGDWKRALNCLIYLVGTATMGIEYSGESGITIFCDSSHGSPEEARLSRSGYAIMLNNAAIAWRSVLQKSQALSSAEAEYMALCAAAQGAAWLKQLLSELGMPQNDPIPVLEDNTACISMASKDAVSQRVKHIDIRYHFVRDVIRSGVISLVYCPTARQAADILTKPVDTLPFICHRATLMGLPSTH